MDEEEKQYIKISRDMLYRLIQEMKEIRKMWPRNTTGDLVKRHKLKMEHLLLDRILSNDGIETIFNNLVSEKEKLILENTIKELEEADNDNGK